MSTTTLTAPVAAFRGRVTQSRVARSDWTKLWSLRSTRWSLLAAVVSMIALGIIFSAVQMGRWGSLSLHDRLTFDSTDIGLGGFHVALLAIGVLGVVVMSGEYSTGMIRSSLMAVPKRLPVLWAKLGVFTGVTFVLMLASALVSFFAAQAITSSHHVNHTLGDPHALRAVIGTALFLTVLGALGVGLGTLIRNTAGGIAALFALLFVLPGITALLPSSTGDAISPYLPLDAGTAVLTSTFNNTHHLTPWTGFAVFCAYAAVIIIAGAVRLARSDA